MNPLYFLLFISLLGGPAALSQTRFTVQGTVVDEASGEVLAGANVYAKSDHQRGSSADAQGHFSLSLTGPDTLIVTFIGYRERLVPVSTGTTVRIGLVSRQQNMDEVVVQAPSLVAEEFTVRKIAQLEIYKNPTAKADPLLAVNSLPSATTLDESANISLRGSTPAETGIFFNDVPIYDAVRFSQLNGIGTFSIFNASLIREVEVFPSNPPLEVGNTTAGLISLRTTEEVPDHFHGSLSLSLANVGLQLSVPTSKKSSLTVFSNYQPAGAIKAVNGDALEDINTFHSLDFGVYLTQTLGERTSLKLFNYTVREGYNLRYRHASYRGDFVQEKTRNFTVFNYKKRFEHATFTFNHGSSFSNSTYQVGNFDGAFGHRDLYFSANYTHFFDQLTLKTGLTYDQRQNDFGGIFPQHGYAMRPEHPTYAFDTLMRYQVPEAYVYGKKTLSKRFKLGVGVRKSIPLGTANDYWSYQLNGHYDLSEAQSLKLSVGRYHKHQLPDDDGSGDFLRSSQVSLDYRYQRDKLDVSAAVFYKDTQRGAIQDQVYGTELAAQVRWSSRLSTQLSYTYLQATEEEAGTTYPSPYDLNYFVHGNVSYQWSDWTVTSTVLFRQGSVYRPVVGRRYVPSLEVYQPSYAGMADQARLPEYGTVNLSLSRLMPISDRLNAVGFANVTNVFNQQNVQTLAYNQDYSDASPTLFSQRTIYFGVMLNFR